MASNRVKTNDMEVNYKFSCRCCLKTEAEFCKLDSLTEVVSGDNDESATKIPLLRLLLFCMRTENLPELPQYICAECSKSLQVAYYFIQNSLRAHEILCRKLCPGKMKTTLRFNGQKHSEANRGEVKLCVNKAKPAKAAVSHECKVCGTIIYDRLELKQHIRMHTGESKQSCKLCKFVAFKQRQLPEHYRKVHGLTAAQIDQQLKRSIQAAAAATKATASVAAADDGQVKVCTLEDIELLIPTVLTPEDFSQPQLDADQLRDIERQLANSLTVDQSNSGLSAVLPKNPKIATDGSANVSIGAEFLVMPDGSLQQVNDGGVVFEYIDDSKSTNNNTNLKKLLDDSKPELTYDSMDVDMNQIVVEDALPQITVKPKPGLGPGASGVMKHKCNLCPKAFPTVMRLKSHQLTHSHLPKFFCDQCSFYSLRSSDLIQHYREEHKGSISDSKNHIQKSTDWNRSYSCDMCLFETRSSVQLKSHYSDKHLIQPNEVQLRPSWTNESKDKDGGLTNVSADASKQLQQSAMSHIPIGITYPSISAVAAAETTETTEINATVAVHLQPQQPTTTAVLTPTGDINVVVDATSLFYAAGAVPTTTSTALKAETPTKAAAADSNEFAIFPEQSLGNSITTTTGETGGMLPAVAQTANTSNSIFGDMQDFIDNTDVAAICTIPADDMPVVDGDDIVIDNNNMSLDFDAENLFEEFEDVEVGEDDDEEEDDPENEDEDENDNNDAAADQNLLLTSDDDDVDDFDDEQSRHLQKPYCIYCNKKFTSQYKFENHMFVHRGLAPYRCELCTNLYNMKRLLIRHYKTVHKRMPTRDMVQAKGDKVSVERTSIEKLNISADKSPMLMCAKCPFECELDGEMRKHLNAHHGINDGVSVHANEVFIIRKLPFECPRCIRTFAAKRTLTRHLQRSHLVDTIIELQVPQLTTSSTATTTQSTVTTAFPKNVSDGYCDIKTGTEQESSSMDTFEEGVVGNADGESDGDGKCADSVINSDTGIETDNEDSDTKTLTPTSITPTAPRTTITTAAIQDDNVPETTITESSPATAASMTTSESPIPSATSSSAHTAQSIDKTPTATGDSTLFSTHTPFDFDMDFIGNESHGPPLKNNNDNVNFNVIPSVGQLLNGTDKLLTAALEPSPIKDLRSRLPRTPIFVCKQCNQTFDELCKLLQHELEQHSNGTVSPRSIYQHQCKVCNTTYRTVTLLNYHMKRHETRKVQCKMCPNKFVSDSELKQHFESEHSKMKCGIDGCLKTFNFIHHLKRHQSASHTRVRYICPECGRDMLTSLQLRNHMSMHKGTHSYKCPKCVRTYMRRTPFRMHALREHKWHLTDNEMDQIYSENDPGLSPKKKEQTLVKVESADV